MPKAALIVSSALDAHIHFIRDQRVMLDCDLALLYGVETKALNRAVVRNAERFPSDFMFRLTREEVTNLKYQIGTSSSFVVDNETLEHFRREPNSYATVHGGRRRSLPTCFTQEGVAMLSSVLHSSRAIAVNIEIMRAFVQLRQLTLSVKELASKVEALEQNYDGQFAVVFDAMKELMTPPPEEPGTIGFFGTPKRRKTP